MNSQSYNLFFFFSASEMEDKKELIVSGLKGVCNEQNNKVGVETRNPVFKIPTGVLAASANLLRNSCSDG